MAAEKKPAGIRSLVYGIGKGKGGIEGLSVSSCLQSPINWACLSNSGIAALTSSKEPECSKLPFER